MSISSLIEPINARLLPTSSFSNFLTVIPGVSRSNTLSLTLVHCNFLVTPGVFSTLLDFLFVYELIKVLLPTFGAPMTMARIL